MKNLSHTTKLPSAHRMRKNKYCFNSHKMLTLDIKFEIGQVVYIVKDLRTVCKDYSIPTVMETIQAITIRALRIEKGNKVIYIAGHHKTDETVYSDRTDMNTGKSLKLYEIPGECLADNKQMIKEYLVKERQRQLATARIQLESAERQVSRLTEFIQNVQKELNDKCQ